MGSLQSWRLLLIDIESAYECALYKLCTNTIILYITAQLRLRTAEVTIA